LDVPFKKHSDPQTDAWQRQPAAGRSNWVIAVPSGWGRFPEPSAGHRAHCSADASGMRPHPCGFVLKTDSDSGFLSIAPIVYPSIVMDPCWSHPTESCCAGFSVSPILCAALSKVPVRSMKRQMYTRPMNGYAGAT